MENLPESRMTHTEASSATIADIRDELDSFEGHEHVLRGLMYVKESVDEV